MLAHAADEHASQRAAAPRAPSAQHRPWLTAPLPPVPPAPGAQPPASPAPASASPAGPKGRRRSAGWIIRNWDIKTEGKAALHASASSSNQPCIPADPQVWQHASGARPRVLLPVLPSGRGRLTYCAGPGQAARAGVGPSGARPQCWEGSAAQGQLQLWSQGREYQRITQGGASCCWQSSAAQQHWPRTQPSPALARCRPPTAPTCQNVGSCRRHKRACRRATPDPSPHRTPGRLSCAYSPTRTPPLHGRLHPSQKPAPLPHKNERLPPPGCAPPPPCASGSPPPSRPGSAAGCRSPSGTRSPAATKTPAARRPAG